MSSAAIQTSGPAIPNRQYQQSPHGREQYYSPQSPNVTNSPASARKPSRRPSGNGASPSANAPTTPQQQSIASGSASSMTSSRNQPLPANTQASPVVPNASTTLPAGGPHVPPRTSSNQKTNISGSGTPEPQLKNLSLEDGPSSSRRAQLAAEGAGESAQTRRKAHPSPKEGSQQPGASSSRSKHSPGHSRSANAVGSPPAGTSLPREESTVISRVITSDPQEDYAREQARQAEARPQHTGTDITPITGLGLVGSEGVDDGGRGAGRSRQDHSRSDRVRKETRFGDYVLGQTIGEGEFGKVKLGWKRDGGVQVAIKLIRRETLGSNPSRLPKIYREISILRGLQHPNIVRLHEMVETERHIGIILEYASGGELFDYILNHRYLKDNAARRLFAQLVSGVGYLHKKGIVHRDLKLENLLLDRNRNIIITDFGFANTFNPDDELGEEIEYRLGDKEFVKKTGLEQVNSEGHRRGDLMQTSCGSPCYAAPELVVSDSLYTGRKVDVWSCGVILYAMLAGYLPFDDDPANPEGDNINLLYKYIVSTPLTFPEYVTPHARDLLKRILVPDPRKRADLFEVARHSWLSEYSHVVGFITSSTTTSSDIANTTVTSQDPFETPMLARSASVREPTKPHTSVTPVGGLQQKTGHIDQPEQRGQRDTKRRTVQVEYVAPQSQTQRGEISPSAASPPVLNANAQGTPRTRTRDTQGPTEVSNTVDPYQTAAGRSSQRPAAQNIPPTKNTRDPPRAVSDSTAFGRSPPTSNLPNSSAVRPSTGGTLTGSRLPSRGNSYGQPAAVTVAATHAQGQVSQPQSKQYVISRPMPQQDPIIGESSIGRPSIGQVPSSYATAQGPQAQKGHKRSSTIGGISEKLFGMSGSIFGRRASQDQSGQKRDRKYPPVSMQAPIPNESYEPRQSTESSRMSFSFSRKTSEGPKQERGSRRFSFMAGLKNLGGGHKESGPPQTSQSVDDRTSGLQSRGQSSTRPGMAFGRGQSRSPSQSTTGSNIPVIYDGQLDSRRRESPAQHGRDARGIPLSAPAVQTNFSVKRDAPASSQNFPYPGQISQSGAYYYNNDSEASQPVIPLNKNEAGRPSNVGAGYAGYELEQVQSRKGVLQKNRRFADEYEQRLGHSGTSGKTKSVMDYFRWTGRERGKEGR